MNRSLLYINQALIKTKAITPLKYCFLFLLWVTPSLTTAADSKGFGSFEVDEEASVRALEHSLVQAGGLLLAVGKLDIETGIGFSRIENNSLLFIPTNNANTSITGEIKNMTNSITMPINARIGLPYDAQIGFSIPVLYIEQLSIRNIGNNAPLETSGHGLGFGDIEVTLSKTLRREKGYKPDVIGFLSWNAANGKNEDNGIFLSDGFNEYRGGLTFTKSQDPLVFSASVSAQVTDEKNNIKPGNQYSLSLATFLAASPSTSLRFAIDQIFIAKTEVNNKEITNSKRTIALLNIGISSVVSPNTFLSLSTGAGLTDDSPDYAINLSLSTRFDLPWN